MNALFCISAIAPNAENSAETALEAPTWLDFLHRLPWWPHWLPVQFAWSVVTIILLASLCYFGTRKMQKIPRGVQNLLEMVVQALENFAEDNIGPGGKAFAPFLGTLFIYITVMNLIGLVPGFSSPTSNLNTTLALALIVFFVVQYHGIRQSGLGYFKHFVGDPWWLFFIMLPMHLIAEFTRPITLALRLRGNINGEDTAIFSFILLAASLPVFLRWLPLQFPLMLLACLTSVIQAFVFILLTAVYLALASPEQAHQEVKMLYLFGLVIATGFAVAVAGFAGSLGQGKAISAAMEGMARQPENSGNIRAAMILGLAFIESLTIYALVMGLILMTKLPNTADILQAIVQGTK